MLEYYRWILIKKLEVEYPMIYLALVESSLNKLKIWYQNILILYRSPSPKLRNWYRTFFPCAAQCMKWQHFFRKCHCFVGYCHMFTIKHLWYNGLFSRSNFNFTNPSLCNFGLKWQILIWSYLKDNHFTEITVHLPYFL